MTDEQHPAGSGTNGEGRDPANREEAPERAPVDPETMKSAHGRTGRMLAAAGLPFEEDEFDEEPADVPGDVDDEDAVIDVELRGAAEEE